jgi:hypothetical protein
MLAAFAALLLATGAAAQTDLNATAAAAVTLSSIMPPKLSVTLRYMIDGEEVITTPCKSQNLGAACLPKVQADSDDAVIINYSVFANQTANLTDYVQLKACYSNYSEVDRPWRKFNNVISKSKKCPIVIKSHLDPSRSNATGIVWKPKDTVATATYFIRAFVFHNSSSTVSYQVAFGNSMGYFQVQAIDPRPKSMKIAAGICSTVGPLMFVGYFAMTYLRKKNV